MIINRSRNQFLENYYSLHYKEPKRHETNLRICALTEDSEHSRSLIRVFTGAFRIAKDTMFLHAVNGDSDQPARMRRLI